MVMVVLGLYDPSPFDLSKIPFPWHVWLGQDTSLPPAMSSWEWFERAQLFHLAALLTSAFATLPAPISSTTSCRRIKPALFLVMCLCCWQRHPQLQASCKLAWAKGTWGRDMIPA